MPASENLKKAVLYAKAHHGLKPYFQAMREEELIWYLDHMADTDGERVMKEDNSEKKVTEHESNSNRNQTENL